MACWLLSYTLANFTHGEPDGCQYSLVVTTPWSYMVSLMADVFDYCGSCLTMSYVLSCHIMSCHALSCLALPCHTVYRAMSCFTISLHVMPCNAWLPHIKQCHGNNLLICFCVIAALSFIPNIAWALCRLCSRFQLLGHGGWLPAHGPSQRPKSGVGGVSHFTSGWQHWPLGYQPCHN